MLPAEIFDRASLRRVLQDKIRHDLAQPGSGARGSIVPATLWPDDLPIGPDGIGADSLDLLTLAGGINQMFHLHRTGIEDLLLARRTLGGWLDLIAQSWASESQAITFTTSGSTGVPSACVHNTQDLLDEASEHARRLQPKRILTAVPSHHIYGFLFTVILPAITGAPVIDIRAGAANARPLCPGDLLVSYPDHWRYLAQTWDTLPPITGVSSTAPLPPELGQRLRDGGLVRLIEIYGSTETAGIAWRDRTGAPFCLLDVWTGAASETGCGSLRISGANGRTASTPDAVQMTGPRDFHVIKRLDSAVQVGGINVYPDRIAAMLKAHPDIADARVRLASGDNRLKAVLVPRDHNADRRDLRQTLHDWISQTLTVPERPRSLTFAAGLPRGHLGKDSDWLEEVEGECADLTVP